MIILEENLKWHLEAFASELFILRSTHADETFLFIAIHKPFYCYLILL